MPVPSSLATLSQTPASNSPDGGDNVFPLLDNYLREMFADFARLRDGAHQFLTSVSGTNTITAVNSQVGAYAAGQSFVFIAAGANTGAVTLNINGLGAKNVTKNGTTALVSGDIPANKFVRVDYDGTQFQLVGAIYKDFLSNAVNTAITSADGTTRLQFTSGGATAMNGTGSVSIMVGGSAHLIVNASGTTTLAADAATGADAVRLGQMNTAIAASQAAATAAATAAALASALGGSGQSWQNVLASRTIATNYTNSTGRPIFVRVTGQTVAGPVNATMLATIDPAGTPVFADSIKFYGNAGGYEGSLGFIVPAGATYRVDIVNCNLNIWSELR